ncbi:MAG TPA: acetylxylan esterase [Kiritimatiellia bacterium]|jgi:cephalosporin-C deacetylase-like acetyl esterase|nr:acetylxylan esterase [Kiritimatiellia bacterium]HOR98132.1 acetylxylan esterase [Kiritimatiellia bacterium]HPK36732.1 acetylxylan esterase [Kiritimatiellia bacterium]HPW75887.1 acetylxylan esterase [Kiritimatiellia bacterium]HRU19289.1 acetylxylan esterase [Kiritimatiellia bacterium]
MTPSRKSIVLLSAALAVWAAFAQSVIEIEMPWPKEGTGFPCGHPVDVSIRHTLDGKATAAKGVKIAFDNFGPKTVRAEETCDLPEQGLRVKGLTLNEPGFLRCRVTVGGKNYVQSVPFEPERIVKGSPTPPDFMTYWQREIAKLDAESSDEPELKPWRGPDTNQWDAWRVSFATAGGKRVYGLLSVPKNLSEGPFPVHVSVPGAGQPSKTYSASWIYSQTPERNTVRLTMFAHCAPIDDAKEREAYFTRIRAEHAEKYGVGYYPQAGISESREAYHFHPIILGANRAVNWLARQSYCDTNRFTYSGSSQGGGFGIILAGLNRHFTRVFADVPAMADTMGARAGRQSGWPQPVETQRPENRSAAERFAPYFDGANFARYVTCPIRVTCGCKDTSCAPPAVYAAYNEIPSQDKQIFVMPHNGHESNGKIKNQAHAWRQGTGERGLAPFDTLTCEVTGVAFGSGANTDPTFKVPKLVAAIRRTDGVIEDVPLRAVNWMGAYLVDRRFSKSERERFGTKAELVGVRLEGGAPETNAKIKIENATMFKEVLNPLSIQVTPRDALPFPNRADTIVPDTPEPAAGDLLAEWNASLPPGCAVSKRRVGKSLVIDITAPAGKVTEIPLGVAREAKKVKSFAIPYLTWGERNGRVHADLLEGGWFRLAEFDWYASNASDVYARETEGGRELVARYKPKTDGTFNPVRERIVITLSNVFEEILPEIPNPASPWKHVTGMHVWRSHPSYDRAEDLALWRQVKAAGIKHVAVTDHETMWRDGGEPFTFCTDAAKGKGGDEAQKAYTRAMIDELGFLYGPYNNFTDLATQSEFFNRDTVGRWSDGSFHNAWMRCYGPKPVLAPLACDRFAGAIQRKFGFNTAYCDVHTSMLPWQRTDYDHRVPGAATYAQTYYSWGETLLKQKKIWNGPVYSEGAHHFMWAGLADGSYAQDRSYDFRNEPWIVEFELLRTQRLCTDFGMGTLSMFSPARTLHERLYYLPYQPQGRDELVNRFLAATIAFGHSGYLILDKCWEPDKPFGRAYGVKSKPVWQEKGLPAETLRSYFMIQALAARYTQSHAVEIRYVDAEGRLHAASEAIRNGTVARNQIVTRYADGTVTAVNGSDTLPMKTSAHGRKIELAPNGFAGWSSGVTVLSTDTDGRRVHYAEGPDYVYREIEGRKPCVSLTSRHETKP